MVHLLVVVAVVGGLRLVAMDLDWQAVDVDADLAPAVAAAHRTYPATGHLGHRRLQHAQVGRLAEHLEQARQRRLRGQVLPLVQRRGAGRFRNGQSQHGIEA
jgi:hypothetical protein